LGKSPYIVSIYWPVWHPPHHTFGFWSPLIVRVTISIWRDSTGINFTPARVALFPGLHAQLLSLTVQKVGGMPGQIYHVMRATADITYYG